MGRVLNEFIHNKGMIFDVYAFAFDLLKCFLERRHNTERNIFNDRGGFCQHFVNFSIYSTSICN